MSNYELWRRHSAHSRIMYNNTKYRPIMFESMTAHLEGAFLPFLIPCEDCEFCICFSQMLQVSGKQMAYALY